MSVFTFNKVFFSLEPRNISLYLFCFSLAWRFSPRRCGSPMSCNFKEFPSSVFQVEARWYFPPTFVQEHCRHRRSTSTRFRDSDFCSSASLTRGCVTKFWSRDRRCWQMRGPALALPTLVVVVGASAEGWVQVHHLDGQQVTQTRSGQRRHRWKNKLWIILVRHHKLFWAPQVF